MRYFVMAAAVVIAAAILYSQSDRPVNWKIGVVDLRRISQRYKKWQENSLKFAQFRDARINYLRKKRRELEEKLAEMADDLRRLEPGSDAYYAQMDKKRQLEFELEMEQERVYRTIKKEAERQAKELIAEIEKAIAEYARQHNFALVLRKDYEELQHLSWVELQGYYARKIVLYHGGAMDITDEIVKILNRGAGEKKEKKEK